MKMAELLPLKVFPIRHLNNRILPQLYLPIVDYVVLFFVHKVCVENDVTISRKELTNVFIFKRYHFKIFDSPQL